MSNKNCGYGLPFFLLLLLVVMITGAILSALVFEISRTIAITSAVIAAVSFLAFIILLRFAAWKNEKDETTNTQPGKYSRPRGYTPKGYNPPRRYSQNEAQRRLQNTTRSGSTKLANKKMIPLETIVFAEDSDDYPCMICKLTIRKSQEILICPFCQSKFHKEHLLEWLLLDDDCPVCGGHLKIKVKQLSGSYY